MNSKITIVYDNTSINDHLVADWGFSCVIETKNRKILFDTGGNGRILLDNMISLGINPETIDDVVISHPDFDHIGGLSHFLNLNSKAVIHNPISFRGIKYQNPIYYYDKPTQLNSNIFVTGELGNREQSLAIDIGTGLVLIVGCGHPTLKKIISTISVYGKVEAIIGGLHDSQEFGVLDSLKLICATHCTKHKTEIQARFPHLYEAGGVGKIFEF